MKTKLTGVIFLIVIVAFFAQQALFAATDKAFVWVQDNDVRDSHFGIYKDGQATYLDPKYMDYDIEGLACLHDTIYASSGMDGKAKSALYRLDVLSGSASLIKVADITVDGQPTYEVASLSEKSDGTLWGYADMGNTRGILRIDPGNGVSTLVKPSRLKIEAIEWFEDVLYMAGENIFYTWKEGEEIQNAFIIKDGAEVEAMDVVDGLLWVGLDEDGSNIVALDPVTGMLVPGGFRAGDDIEGLTFCEGAIVTTPSTPTSTGTATAIHTATSTPTATKTPVPAFTKVVTDEPPTQTPTPTTEVTPTPTQTATSTATTTEIIVATATEEPGETPTAPTNEDDDDEPVVDFPEVFLPVINKN